MAENRKTHLEREMQKHFEINESLVSEQTETMATLHTEATEAPVAKSKIDLQQELKAVRAGSLNRVQLPAIQQYQMFKTGTEKSKNKKVKGPTPK